MVNIFFTSDHHFGHKGIIKHSYRPFSSVEEMDAIMLERWNNTVKSNDIVYHLGDISVFNATKTKELVDKLNGKIYLILGNHDSFGTTGIASKRFEWIKNLAEIKIKDQKITLCHYAMKTWNCSHYGAWHLYGHSHGSLKDDLGSLSIDVGVDCFDFYPVLFEQVREIMSKKSFVPIDHHTNK